MRSANSTSVLIPSLSYEIKAEGNCIANCILDDGKLVKLHTAKLQAKIYLYDESSAVVYETDAPEGAKMVFSLGQYILLSTKYNTFLLDNHLQLINKLANEIQPFGLMRWSPTTFIAAFKMPLISHGSGNYRRQHWDMYGYHYYALRLVDYTNPKALKSTNLVFEHGSCSSSSSSSNFRSLYKISATEFMLQTQSADGNESEVLNYLARFQLKNGECHLIGRFGYSRGNRIDQYKRQLLGPLDDHRFFAVCTDNVVAKGEPSSPKSEQNYSPFSVMSLHSSLTLTPSSKVNFMVCPYDLLDGKKSTGVLKLLNVDDVDVLGLQDPSQLFLQYSSHSKSYIALDNPGLRMGYVGVNVCFLKKRELVCYNFESKALSHFLLNFDTEGMAIQGPKIIIYNSTHHYTVYFDNLLNYKLVLAPQITECLAPPLTPLTLEYLGTDIGVSSVSMFKSISRASAKKYDDKPPSLPPIEPTKKATCCIIS